MESLAPTPRIVLGTMTFGAQVNLPEACRMVDVARQAGVTMFDTSNNYTGGEAERMLGKVVGPFRDEIRISTKGGSHVDQADSSVAGLARRALRKAVDGSLSRLGIDVIDIYYLHRPDRTTPIEETLEALAELVAEGKIRELGQSNFAAWQIAEIAYLSRANNWPEMRWSQPMYNLIGRRIETEYLECSERLGLINITYNPLAGGLLTGKHSLDESPAPGSRFSKELYRDRYWNAAQFKAVTQLREIAQDAGLTLVELAYAWLLSRPSTQGILIGASSAAQLESNVHALGAPSLDGETLSACDEVWLSLEGAAPRYNR